jgi:hypothetical protein
VVFEERRGGLRRGFERRIFHRDFTPLSSELHNVGFGVNMAFRREAIEAVGGFDPSFEVAGSTRGVDLDLWARLLESGWAIVYEPDALTLRFHPGTLRELVKEIRSTAIGSGAFLARRAALGGAQARDVSRRVRRRQLGLAARGMGALARGDLVHLRMLVAEFQGRRVGYLVGARMRETT